MRRVAAIAWAVLVLSSAHAGEMAISAKLGTGIEREWLSISHDASALSPLLGSPTSVLSYDPFSIATTDLTFSASSAADRYFDLDISSAVWGSGDFSDSDYSAGQTLTSLSFSRATIASDIAIGGRLGIPGFAPRLGAVQLTTFAAARLQASSYKLTGLTCTSGCTVPLNVGANTLVMQHDMTDASIGAGMRAEFALLGGTSLVEAEVGLGRASLADGHLLRKDLGPMPNILSTFTSVRADMRLRHEQPIASNLAVQLSIDGSVETGWGETVFGANSSAALAPIPAIFSRSRVGARIGLVGRLP